MIDGDTVVDVHVHAHRLDAVKPAWPDWGDRFAKDHPWRSIYDAEGHVVPASLDVLLDSEGVDRALLFCEYSPRSLGILPIEENLPIVEYNPRRFRLVANVNPHLHHPIASEVERQLGLGAVALKIHPVHGGFSPAAAELYRAYEVCAERGVPVVMHSGSSTFPGSRARFGDPALLADVADDFPEVQFVLAHGGRGWWYDTAAFLAITRPNMWIDLAGLPPHKLPEYYARFDFHKLAAKCVFGTDWPGVPGVAKNVAALRELGLPRHLVRDVLAGNAAKVYPGLDV